jgi:hypothetical protein
LKKIAVITFDPEANVWDGLSKLIDLDSDVEVLIPVTSHGKFVDSALLAIREAAVPFRIYLSVEETIGSLHEIGAELVTICEDPIKAILNQITPDDILAMVWDDSTRAHLTLHSLEDFGIDAWDISNGLDVIEVDYEEESTEDLFEMMQNSMSVFVEDLANYMISSVLDVITESVMERIQEDDGKKDIDIFEDEDE